MQNLKKVNVAEKLDLFSDYWNPKIAAELNDSYIKLAKMKGEFLWHRHENEDELFLVIKGRLVIRLRDHEVRLEPGEFVVVPRGVEHLPVAEEEAHVILIEPKTTLNTGDAVSDKTVTDLVEI
jgi:mannose-6-phosphate isomerase-like protein (cupin superfamily)